jgi:xylan 1,4-beta-xylosidase
MRIGSWTKHIITVSLCAGFCVTSSFAAKFTVTVDAAKSWGELPHFWSCFGTDRYGIFYTHPLIKEHLQDCVKNLGMDKIRSHGILHDDIGIYKEVNGQVVYNWTKSDSVMDFLLSEGVRPIVEFGSMPKDLASDPNRVSFPDGWRQGISPPKDMTKWRNLIFEFVKHYKEKYGAAEIEKWRFEVWNEPELDAFWSGSEAQYLELYKNTVNGAKAADSAIKIGGPTPSGPYIFSRITNLLNYCKTNKLPIECVYYHTWNMTDSRAGHFQALDIINQFDPNIESIDTEWGPSYAFNMAIQPQDNTQGTICIANAICSIARRCHTENKKFPWAFSWWIISDIFEEAGWNGYRNQPMNTGNMGLISREGIYKPTYNVFKMLNMMGKTQVSIATAPNGGVNGMAAMGADSSVQVMVYNLVKEYGPLEGVEQPPSGSDSVTISISGVAPTKVDYRCMLVDGEHSNSYSAWLGMGKPNTGAMNADKWKTLRTAMVLDTIDSANGLLVTNKTFTRSFALRKEGVMLISLTPVKSTPVKDNVSAGKSRAIGNYAMVFANGSIQITPTDNRPYTVEIIALNGKVLQRRHQVQGSCRIPGKTINPGVYVIMVVTADGAGMSKPLMVPRH